MSRDHLPAPPLPLARADLQARALRAALDRVALALAGVARRFVDGRGWLVFGYARIEEHTRERFSRSGRWLRDLAALAKAVERLPGLAASLTGADGGPALGRVASLLIGRVASPESLAAWVELAQRLTVRELRQAVRWARGAGVSFPPGSAQDQVSPRDSGPDGAALDGARASEGATSGDAPGSIPDDGGEDGDGCDDDEARTQVRIPVPSAARAAFDEALDLYRAVVGREASVTSFLEDLVAEASSGPHPPDAERRALHRSTPAARVEEAMARATSGWRQLDDEALAGLPGWDPSAEGNDPTVLLIRRLDELACPVEGETPPDLDARLRGLLEVEDSLERRLGEHLAAMGESGAWLRLHFAGVGHYAEQRLGLSRTQAQTRARVARRLRDRPVLRRAYESGAVGLEAVSLLLRLPAGAAGPGGDAAWVSRAAEVTVKRLRDELRTVQRGVASIPPVGRGGLASSSQEKRAPFAPPNAPAPNHAAWAAACGSDEEGGLPPEVAGMPLTDEAWLASLRRDRGTARRRLAELVRLALSIRVSNDRLCLRLPAWLADSFLSTLESARRTVESARSFSILGSDGSPKDTARSLSTRRGPLPTWVGLLAILDEFVATWDPPGEGFSGRRPADEAVYARDGWRCMAPGCTSRRNLEDHHLVYRSRGGGNEAENRICLCRFHHQRGEHGGLARCHGRAPLGVVWSLGRGGVGGGFRNERVLGSPAFPAAVRGARAGSGGADCAL